MPNARAEAAEAGDHLVDDQQQVVAIADRAHALEPARRRDDHAAHPLHRLGDDGADAVRALARHHRLELVGAGEPAGRVGLAQLAAVAVRARDARHLRELRAVGPDGRWRARSGSPPRSRCRDRRPAARRCRSCRAGRAAASRAAPGGSRVSFDSEPPEVNITWRRPFGAMRAMRAARRMAGSVEKPSSVGAYSRARICAATARAISPRPWPTATFQSDDRPSR